MTITEFMNQEIDALRDEIITELDDSFDSHDFIENFAHRFEEDYIRFLYNETSPGAFRALHSKIAKFLSENRVELSIDSTHNGKERSSTIFGSDGEVEGWVKV